VRRNLTKHRRFSFDPQTAAPERMTPDFARGRQTRSASQSKPAFQMAFLWSRRGEQFSARFDFQQAFTTFTLLVTGCGYGYAERLCKIE
jgi:hypothetical protein